MNHVWLFFKLIEVTMGSMCMFFHVHGSMYVQEPLPHVLIYCATFLAFILLTGLGALRLMFVKTSVLPTQLLITASAAILHSFCGLLIMRTALEDPHLPAINNTFEHMKHLHFAHCKQQSIASLVTGTMYLMHMFHVLDIMLRLEPGDWRKQAMDPENDIEIPALATRAGLYVLSRPVDNFLCDHFRCYDKLAHNQPLRFQASKIEQSKMAGRFLQMFANVRIMLCSVTNVDSDESFMSTPSITTSETSESEELGVPEERHDKKRRTAANWRGPSDSSSLWDQIEDRSTFNSIDSLNRPPLAERKARRTSSIWDDLENKQKSDILLVEQTSHDMSHSSSAFDTLKERRRSSRGSSDYGETTDRKGEDKEPPKEPKGKK